ncbi:MAG: DUF4832 domain-containing protein [Armatimonadetes bacterium]|nr:DUF4832 domain-containing protein [Armatimonadota bacterium]
MLFTALLASLLGQAAPAPMPLLLRPPATDRILLNPGMGLYAQCGGNPAVTWPADAWWLPAVDIGYFRMDWADVQPNGPDDDPLAYFDKAFDVWVNKLGKRVAIRVMSESMHSRYEYATPKWVFDSGVPGVDHVGLYAKHQVDPVFWDDRYLDAACRFIARLGQALDGRPDLEFVDIGQIGEWGEMHLGQHAPGRWTPEQLEATGYTETRYVAAYRRVIDAYAAAFPRTRVFLNVGDRGQINDYAALRGMHFRQDGLNPGGPSANVGELYYKPYAPRGVIGMYEFFASYDEMVQRKWDLRRTLDAGLSAPISYLNTNLYGVNSLHRAPPEVQTMLLDTARRIGYRFGVDQVETLGPVRSGARRAARLPVVITFANRGVAWCHVSYAVEVGLLPADGTTPVASELVYPAQPTTRWEPGKTAVVGAALTIPANTAPGRYRLVARLRDADHQGKPIALDLAPLADGWHELGSIPVVLGASDDQTAYQDGFEGEAHAWRAAPGMTAAVAAPGREGGHALHLTGTQPDAWSLASTRVPLAPGSKCRLTAWMKVDDWQPGTGRPSVKMGANNREGRWLNNFTTTGYDLAGKGTWQRLAITFVAPFESANGDIALEKGGTHPVTADIWIDDVSVEVLEAP